MAGKIYTVNKTIPPPRFDAVKGVKAYLTEIEEYIQKLQQYAKENGNGDLAGELIKFPVGDGYARYIIYSTTPKIFLHDQSGDAYHFPYVTNLSVKELRDKVKSKKAVDKLFGKK